MPLSDGDKSLVRLFMTACFHSWEHLPERADACYQAGCTLEEVRGCVRHLIVVAGYGPCLAATIHLHNAKKLEGNTPGKVGGHPGDAFDCVYATVADTVRTNMHAVDPVLAEYIRLHLYGDVYSSPGLSLRQKQVLMCAFLGEANMPDQLFGHLYAAMRFGNDTEALLKAIDIGFEQSPKPREEVYKSCMKTLEMTIASVLQHGPCIEFSLVHTQGSKLAHRKFKKDFSQGPPGLPEVQLMEPDAVRVPTLQLKDTAASLWLDDRGQVQGPDTAHILASALP